MQWAGRSLLPGDGRWKAGAAEGVTRSCTLQGLLSRVGGEARGKSAETVGCCWAKKFTKLECRLSRRLAKYKTGRDLRTDNGGP